MQKGYIRPKDFEKQFKITPSQNSQAAQVSENLSGRAQLLKSADHSVVYKNFNEGDIEETSLVGDAYNRSIQADQTDQYDPNVTTNHLEVAPQINKQTTLTDSHNTIVNNLSETVNTSDHRETLNLNQEVYIQNKQETIPTSLQQKITNFGGLASQALTRQTDTRNVKSQNYTERFEKSKTQGSMNISGNGSLYAKKIYVGGPVPDERIDFTLRDAANKFYPTVSGELFSEDLKLHPLSTKNFVITGKLVIEGTLAAQNIFSVNPVSLDQKGLTVDLTETINDYYAAMHISNINDFNTSTLPEIDVSYSHGKITFSNSMGIEVKGNTGKGYAEVVYTHPPQKVDVPIYRDWQLNMTTQVKLITRFYPKAKPPSVLKERIEVFARLFWEGLQQEYEIARPYIPFVIPEEAPASVDTEVLPIILKLRPMMLKAKKGLEHAYN